MSLGCVARVAEREHGVRVVLVRPLSRAFWGEAICMAAALVRGREAVAFALAVLGGVRLRDWAAPPPWDS
eukprot:11187387-Lingulodinium_polyedra.AAC.1